MKSHTLILLFLVATLSCRAQNSAANSADQSAASAKSAQAAGAISTPTKATDSSAPADENNALTTMDAMVVDSSMDMKPAASDLKKDLAAMRAEQRASMAQQLADESQKQKTAFAGILAIEQPMFSLPKLSTGAAPVVALAPANEKKSLVGAAPRSK